MTLEELKSKCFSMPGHVAPSRLYVFTDEDSADEWIENGSASELTMVIQSDMVAEVTLTIVLIVEQRWRRWKNDA